MSERRSCLAAGRYSSGFSWNIARNPGVGCAARMLHRWLLDGILWFKVPLMFIFTWTAWLHLKFRKCCFGLRSVGLKFPRPSLEAQFLQFQAEGFVASYQYLVQALSVLGILISFHQIVRCKEWIHAGVPLCLAICTLLGCKPDERQIRLRGRGLFIPIRLMVVSLGAYVASNIRVDKEPGGVALYEVICLKSGLLFQSFAVFGVPLLFQTNLVLSLVETGLVVAVCGHSFCGHLHGVLTDLLHQTWFSLDQTALKVLECMFGMAVHDTAVCPHKGECTQLFGFLQVQSSKLFNALVGYRVWLCANYAVLVILQVFIGIFVLNYLVWIRERCDRVNFLTRECNKERIPPPDNSQVLGVALIVHILVFVTLFGAVWRFWGTLLAWTTS